MVWTYSGVRPLYDDGASSATAATRDYTLKVDSTGGAPVLNVFGGKITTYRRLAESGAGEDRRGLSRPARRLDGGRALARRGFPGGRGCGSGGAVEGSGYPFLSDFWALRLVRAYGTEAFDMLGGAQACRRSGP